MQDNGTVDFVGNRTECALLVMLRKLGADYTVLRTEREQDQIKVRGLRRWSADRPGTPIPDTHQYLPYITFSRELRADEGALRGPVDCNCNWISG